MNKFTKAQTKKIETFNKRFGDSKFVETKLDGEIFAEHHCRILQKTWYIDRKGTLYDSRFNRITLR